MIRLICISIVLFLQTTENPFAQCETPAKDLFRMIDKGTLANPIPNGRSVSQPPYVFRVYTHILRNDDGSNAATSLSTLNWHLNNMSDQFADHEICFLWVGNDFIDNTTWNVDFEVDMIDALHAVNPHAGAIDIYVHNGLVGSGGGSAYAIPSAKFSVDIHNWFNFAHEMGHALGLFHTFDFGFGFECPTGSNCLASGDLVCDTPADYTDSEDNLDSLCVYSSVSAIYCDGDWQTYEPPHDNHMSYGAWCTDNFTIGQGARMHQVIQSSTGLQNRLAPTMLVISDITETSELADGGFETVSIGNMGIGDVNLLSGVKAKVVAGESVTIKAGSLFKPTGSQSFVDVKITPTSCNQ